jgi:hypothetical protein
MLTRSGRFNRVDRATFAAFPAFSNRVISPIAPIPPEIITENDGCWKLTVPESNSGPATGLGKSATDGLPGAFPVLAPTVTVASFHAIFAHNLLNLL